MVFNKKFSTVFRESLFYTLAVLVLVTVLTPLTFSNINVAHANGKECHGLVTDNGGINVRAGVTVNGKCQVDGANKTVLVTIATSCLPDGDGAPSGQGGWYYPPGSDNQCYVPVAGGTTTAFHRAGAPAVNKGGGSEGPTSGSGGLEGDLALSCADNVSNNLISKDGFISTLCTMAGNPVDQSIIEVIVEQAANVVLFLGVVGFSIMIALAGLQITTSGGSPEGIKAGKRRLMLAASSLALISLANVIMRLFGLTGDSFFGVNVANGVTTETLGLIIASLFSNIQFLAGAASIIFVTVGGIRLMTAAGNPQAIAGAKKTITYALIGLAVTAGIGLISATVTLIITGRIFL